MLNFFRSESGNYVVGAIVVGIIVVFALEFRTGRGNPTANFKEACAVAYAGSCVDQKDYFAAFGLVARSAEPKAARAMHLKKQVLDGLTERELLATEAERLGLAISDDLLDTELTAGRAHISLPVDQAETLAYRLGLCRRTPGGCDPGTPMGVRQLHVTKNDGETFDYQLYEKEIRILANRGPKEFRAAQERELLAEAMRDLVRQRVRIADAEAFAIYDRDRSKAVVRSVVLSRNWFGKFAIDTSDAAVDKWAAENTKQVDEAWTADKDKFTADCPLVSEISLPLVPNALESEKDPVKERLLALKERITKGETFDAVAREASSAPTSAFGGKRGCLYPGSGADAEALLESAKKLTPGAVSDVIETPRALVLLRLDGKLAAASTEREGRRQIARTLYLASASDQSMRTFATEIIKQARSGAKLEDATRALTDELARRGARPAPNAKAPASPPGLLSPDRPRFDVSPPFTASGNPLPEIEANESMAGRAFALATPDAVDERPVETSTGLVVLQLKEKQPASRADFDKNKTELIRQLSRMKATEALSRYVAELRKKAGDKLKVDAHFAEEKAQPSGED
ncbi:MAG TPA: SurA N-terminal domain-containing protein [Polyangiaceae bacterium]|nr:SurA N-terminal domain-containing protein [Polyangiaceae bacterium]